MRVITSLSMLVLVLTGASALAANPFGKTLAGQPTVASIRFSVPYSFSNVTNELDHAVIRCVAQRGKMSPAIAWGEFIVMLNGQPRSGTAVITVTPASGRNLSDAKHYSCGMQLSNGKMAMPPQRSSGPAWAKAQPGSVAMVDGEIK
jgi:hypothetical protein